MRPRPNTPDQDSLRQPTNRCRIDDPLSYWGGWFSNRHISSVFAPSLALMCLWAGVDGKNPSHPLILLLLCWPTRPFCSPIHHSREA